MEKLYKKIRTIFENNFESLDGIGDIECTERYFAFILNPEEEYEFYLRKDNTIHLNKIEMCDTCDSYFSQEKGEGHNGRCKDCDTA